MKAEGREVGEAAPPKIPRKEAEEHCPKEGHHSKI